jgi:hypothetical protein
LQPQILPILSSFSPEQQEWSQSDTTSHADRVLDLAGERLPERPIQHDSLARLLVQDRPRPLTDGFDEETPPRAIGGTIVQREGARQLHRPAPLGPHHEELARQGHGDRAIHFDGERAAAEIAQAAQWVDAGFHGRSGA